MLLRVFIVKKTIIDYEELVQNALRSVVRHVLDQAVKKGLPGNHHFYISFATDHPGVDLPDYLRDLYPEDITIVLQHEFWDLVVEDKKFSVTLCFNDVHERLTIPFDAIISFVDPSIKFGLQFTPTDDVYELAEPELVKERGSKSKTPKKQDEGGGEEKSGDDSNIVTLDSFRRK
jgi:hypothetical protein